jgi:hypothetical protein
VTHESQSLWRLRFRFSSSDSSPSSRHFANETPAETLPWRRSGSCCEPPSLALGWQHIALGVTMVDSFVVLIILGLIASAMHLEYRAQQFRQSSSSQHPAEPMSHDADLLAGARGAMATPPRTARGGSHLTLRGPPQGIGSRASFGAWRS